MSTFTFRQVGVASTEFQALPGPEARALRAKSMRHAPFLGPGGQAVLSLITGVFRCRGARLGARWARPILRKHGDTSEWISFPADAFSAHRPCFRATSLLFSRKQTRKSEDGQAGPCFPPPSRLGCLFFRPGDKIPSLAGRERRKGLMKDFIPSIF